MTSSSWNQPNGPWLDGRQVQQGITPVGVDGEATAIFHKFAGIVLYCVVLMARTSMKREGQSPSLGPVLGSARASTSSSPTTMTMSVKGEETFFLRTPSTPTTASMNVDMKLEPRMSPSQSPTLAETSIEKMKFSRTPTPASSTTNGTKSETPTPPPQYHSAFSSGNLKKAATATVQMIGQLPVARDEALRTFCEISGNNYQYKTLGRCKELSESMTCDCTYDHGIDNPKNACGHGSDCINRLTQVECLPDDCRCGHHCQNQRFQRKEYATIDIVLTEKKGYGLRAERDLPKDTFIYEYVGDVVNTPSFKKRMRDYGEEGIEHFYFMMLQKDEFIDATKNGGIGRFANHSCNPNCYVAKWTIGDHVRMGIFSKRDIRKYEEITFNYNVDRYGHQAQPCYCGESNCVGFIGGKTQTDIMTLDDLYLDALGITDEADVLELKGTKKKRGKKIDDPDFVPTLKPIVEKDVPKVVQAIRQTQSRKVLSKLLTRIKITADQAALRQIMRLRGYSLMTNLLEEYSNDCELVLLALQCMSTWPLLNRNKVEDSKVLVSVQGIAQLEDIEDNSRLRSLAQRLVDHWENLPLYNRIPKRAVQDGEDKLTILTVVSTADDDDRPWKKLRQDEENGQFKAQLVAAQPTTLPQAWGFRPSQPVPSHPFPFPRSLESAQQRRESIQAIIDQAAAAEAAAAEAAVAAAAVEREKVETIAVRKKVKVKKALTTQEKEENKERKLQKLVGAIVVKCMSKYAKVLNRELFKKYAKELTHVIVEKEKKSSTFKEGRLDALSEEKTAKIKKFAKEYIAKVLRKVEKSKKDGPSSSVSISTSAVSPSLSHDTLHFAEGVYSSMGVEMTMGEAMDMESESEAEEHDDEGRDDSGDPMISASEMLGIALAGPVEESPRLEQLISPDVANEPMVKDSSHTTTDPRRRPVPDTRA
ncbi:hypothetical protein APHAL10511_002846 [Amanita phalloides]|nr:hypothetical protein APHAL10511_002846 [Amanita phalloides]